MPCSRASSRGRAAPSRAPAAAVSPISFLPPAAAALASRRPTAERLQFAARRQHFGAHRELRGTRIDDFGEPLERRLLLGGGAGVLAGSLVARVIRGVVTELEQVGGESRVEIGGHCLTPPAPLATWGSLRSGEDGRVGDDSFIMENIGIQHNVVSASYSSDVTRLLFLGSSCIYPRDCPQPIREEYFMTGPLEATNRAYAIAKISGIEMCWAYNRQYGTQYLAAMPTNLYGLSDNYDANSSHVIPALIRKVAEAKELGLNRITVWGSGKPRREFLFSDDLAEASIALMTLEESRFRIFLSDATPPLVNIGKGEDIAISDVVRVICSALDYSGEIIYDISMPDGTLRKLLDSSKIHGLGWKAKVELSEGIRLAYENYASMHARCEKNI